MADPTARDADRSTDRENPSDPIGSSDQLPIVSEDSVPSGEPMNRMARRRRLAQSGYSLIELLAVVAVLLIIAALAVPQILGMREKAKGKECDRLFHALDSEIHNALDDLIFTSTEVIDIVLRAHGDEDRNPRNKTQPVFVQSVNSSGVNYVDPALIESCQIVFSGSNVLTVAARQARPEQDEGGGEPTFAIGLQ